MLWKDREFLLLGATGATAGASVVIPNRDSSPFCFNELERVHPFF